LNHPVYYASLYICVRAVVMVRNLGRRTMIKGFGVRVRSESSVREAGTQGLTGGFLRSALHGVKLE